MPKPTLLLTGATGFIGSSIVNAFSTDFNLVLLARSSRSTRQFPGHLVIELVELQPFLSDHYVDTVINLAGYYTFSSAPIEVSGLIGANIEFPTQVAAAVAQAQSHVHWIQASTFMQHFRSHEFDPTCLYASTKQAFEDVLKYFESRGFAITTLVLPQVYGEMDNRGKLLDQLLDSARRGNEIKLSSGTQVLDLVHISDIVAALRMCVATPQTGRWQLSSGRSLRILDIVNILENQMGVKLQISYDPSRDRPRDVYELWESAPALPGWTPAIQIESWLAKQFPQ